MITRFRSAILAGLILSSGCAPMVDRTTVTLSSDAGAIVVPPAEPAATADLTETYWKLMQLGDQSVLPEAEQREAHLVLRAQDQRVAGSGGCNRLMGAYTRDGDRLQFGSLATTMMACPESQMGAERRFLDALAEVRIWRIVGPHLELWSEAGQLIARFEAVPLR